MKDLRSFSDETIAVHAGTPDNEHLAVVTPIYQTSTFKFTDADHGGRLFRGEEKGFIYTRMLNPTVQCFEEAVAALENGHKALACGSGMAASHLIFSAMVQQGDHVICSEAVYGPTTNLLNNIHQQGGVETSFVNTADMDAVRQAIQPNTRLIYVETPGNPTLVISDLSAIVELAREQEIKVAVDNTFASPILQKPLVLGVDVVMHSLTKFINGHADVVGGIVIVRDEEMYIQFRKTLNLLGGVLPPMEAFLVHRGLKTLALRMERHCQNAHQVATYLENHPKVEWVRYPGLESHPQCEIAKRQMMGFGGMISFSLKDGFEAGKTLMNNVHLCQLAVSLGGVETLIQHPASMTHASMDQSVREQAGITDGLVRLSIGIENVKEIIDDIDQALSQIS